MKSFPCRMRRVHAASAFQYSWSIWEATCARPPHGHRYATGKFGSKTRWLRFWVASWIWCTVLGTCRTIVASWWTRTRHPTSSRMKSSARHGLQADCNMGTDITEEVHCCGRQPDLLACPQKYGGFEWQRRWRLQWLWRWTRVRLSCLAQFCTYCAYLPNPVHNILHPLNFGVF